MTLRYRLGQIAAYVVAALLGICVGWVVMDLIDSCLPWPVNEDQGQDHQQDQAGKGLDETVKKAAP